MQVRESARQWQHTFDALREGIALLDADGNVVRSNAAFSITAGEEGSTQRRAIADAFGRLLRLPGRQSRECISEERIYSVGLEPVRDDAGQVSGAVCVVTDTTEEREFERQMQQTARLESIGVLAGGIAHDYNNLLTGIIGNASLLIEQMPASSPDREIVNEILRAG